MKHIYFLLPFTLSLFACPSPSEEVSTLQITLQAAPNQLPTNIQLDNFFISVQKMSVVSDVDTQGRSISGNQIVNILTESEKFILSDAPPSLYSKVSFQINGSNIDQNLPQEFHGEPLSLLIEGRVTLSNNQEVPFVFCDKTHLNISLSFPEGIDLFPGEDASVLVLQGINLLFENISFDSIRNDDLIEGTLLIDTSDPSSLASRPRVKEISDTLQTNIRRSFFVDDDSDNRNENGEKDQDTQN